MKRVAVLISHEEYLVPGILELEDEDPLPDQSYRWKFPPYWLVLGKRGRHWCRATGRRDAIRVYRGIPWDSEEEDDPQVSVPARRHLAVNAVFWIKPGPEASRPYRKIRNGMEVISPDGYDHITQPHTTTNMAPA